MPKLVLKAGSRPPWVGLGAAVWVQLAAGNSYNFPLFSSEIKSVLGYNQQQITILGVANDIGESVGILPGIACNKFPPWFLLLVGTVLCFLGYGVLWLSVSQTVQNLPYWLVSHSPLHHSISKKERNFCCLGYYIWSWLPITTGWWVSFIQELKLLHTHLWIGLFWYYCWVGSVVFLCIPVWNWLSETTGWWVGFSKNLFLHTRLSIWLFWNYWLVGFVLSMHNFWNWLYGRTFWWISFIQIAHPLVHLIVLKLLLDGFNFFFYCTFPLGFVFSAVTVLEFIFKFFYILVVKV